MPPQLRSVVPEPAARDRFHSSRTSAFTESVIREMTRLAMRHKAINLAQGFPDFAAPEALKEAARQAITADVNQYAITWGAKDLREAIVRHARQYQGMVIDPETERILGVGMVGAGAGENIAEGVLAVEMAALASDLKLSIHPHPTMSETLMEAAEVFFGHATHVYRPKKKSAQ